MTSSRVWTVNLRRGMLVLATLAPPTVTPVGLALDFGLTLMVMSLPSKFSATWPSEMSCALTLPAMTWLRSTFLTVAVSGAFGRLSMNVLRAASVGAKSVSCPSPLSASTRHHVVEKVLPTLEKGDNIAAVLTKDGRFGTLLAAVTAADLAGAVSSTDGLTVFAPTDDAFAKVPKETLNFLLKPENKGTLTDVLTRHVVPEALFSEAICWKTYKTLNPKASLSTELYKLRSYHTIVGSRVKVTTSDAKEKAIVVDAGIVATNGVIHAIDTVI